LKDSGLFTGVAGEVVTRESFVDLRPRVVLEHVGREVETLAVTRDYCSVLGIHVSGSDFSSGTAVADSSPLQS
jgi:hypothetical protein